MSEKRQKREWQLNGIQRYLYSYLTIVSAPWWSIYCYMFALFNTLKATNQAAQSKLILHPTRACHSTAAPPRRQTAPRTYCWAVHPSVTTNASIRSINSVAKSSTLPKHLLIESTKELSILTGPPPPQIPPPATATTWACSAAIKLLLSCTACCNSFCIPAVAVADACCNRCQTSRWDYCPSILNCTVGIYLKENCRWFITFRLSITTYKLRGH